MLKKFNNWICKLRLSISLNDYNIDQISDFEAKYIAKRISERYPLQDQFKMTDKIQNELKNLQLQMLIEEEKKIKNAENNIKLIKTNNQIV